ncbi:YdcF family protein [Labilibacter marinus]|uniref:YdcF family protein n=1 Tax=Labilibacter marinus TaxID=1477105 RepID=UPI001301368C|nr:YdcF family protein [Labilibacter marinus]
MLSVGILLVFSNSLLFYHVSAWWEGDLQNNNEIGHYDGVILLGGFSSYQENQERIIFNGSSDRLLQAINLYKIGKADRFIFAGGSASVIVREKGEGEYMGDFLSTLGISKDSILVEAKSRNTHENAQETMKVLKDAYLEKGNYLLVTSGFHMKRAMGCFKKEGIQVTPYSTDLLRGNLPPEIWEVFTPSATALATWERLFREWVGYVVYKIKGYV